MAAPFLSTPFQPYVYQNPQAAVTAFQILGGDSQIVQIIIKSQEKVTAKPGIWQWLFGKSATSIVLFNPGPDDGFVGIAAPSSARILMPDALLCSIHDVTVTSTTEQRARNIEVGAQVILKQKLKGQGLSFLVGGGSVVQKILGAGEELVVDVASIVAMTNTISIELKHPNLIRRTLFGGANQLATTLKGPGVIFIQSLPFQRLSQCIARAAAAPSMRDNPKLFFQIAIFLFLAYVMIVSSIILTDI